MVRSACCGWAGALLSCCSECLCWTREGVTETPTTTACLLGLAVVGAAAETLRCSFLSFEYSYCLIPTAAKAVLGFILHQQRWLFAVGLFCVWPFAPAALLSSTSWSAEPKLCSKTCCVQALQVSLTVSHRPLQHMKDWLKKSSGLPKNMQS